MKKVIIIGGGVAGLSAGVYAQKCGFDVTVLESHSIAGGNCTSWKRNGYLFEGGMHWLTGSGKNEPIYKLWRHIGALDDGVEILYPEPFIEYDYQGTLVRLYRNVDATENHLIELAPEDEKEIRNLCDNIRKVQNLAMPVSNVRGVKVTKRTLPPISQISSGLSALGLMRAFSRITRDDYANRFTHAGIRDLINASTNDKSGVIPIFFTMGTLARGDGGFPVGGSLPFIDRITKTFAGLGGKILFNTRVNRVVVEQGRATGVIAGKEFLSSDAVIISVDTMTVDKLFEAPLQADWLDSMRTTTEPTMNMLLCLGVNSNLKKYPKTAVFKLNKPIIFATQNYEYLGVNNYADDPVYSPEGKTAMTISLGGDTYDFWKKAKEEDRYAAEKQKLADIVIEALTTQIPEIEGQIEVCDIATPLTYERYCGNWKGSWMTEMTPSMKMKEYPSAIKGLSGVYFAGQRIMPPGGLPVALMSGRTAVQYLCRDTNTVFVSED